MEISTQISIIQDKVQGSQYICLSVILFNSGFRTGNNQYPEVLLEEIEYVVKEKKYVKVYN